MLNFESIKLGLIEGLIKNSFTILEPNQWIKLDGGVDIYKTNNLLTIVLKKLYDAWSHFVVLPFFKTFFNMRQAISTDYNNLFIYCYYKIR